jgi:hypothetical protein
MGGNAGRPDLFTSGPLPGLMGEGPARARGYLAIDTGFSHYQEAR